MKIILQPLLNPNQFALFAKHVGPVCGAAAAALFSYGLYLAFWNSPPDYQQGETVRIMYLHVPCAWMGLMIYAAMAVGAAIHLALRAPLADVFCTAAGPVGTALTALCLMTGSLWGKPTWGAWWVWDARLTSVLFLFLLYCGYMVLRHAFDDDGQGARISSWLLILGTVNVPIVRFSVEWWHSLHQGSSVMRPGGPSMPPEMLTPLLMMAAGMLFYSAWIIFLRMRTELLQRKHAALKQRDLA